MKAGARTWIAAIAAFVPFPLLALLATWWRNLSGLLGQIPQRPWHGFPKN